MLRLSIYLAAAIYGLLRAYAPTNRLIDQLSTRRGLKWAIPVGAALVPTYLLAARLTVGLIERGAPGWLNLLVLTPCWNAIKFTAMMPVSLLMLMKARADEWRTRRAERYEGHAPGRQLGPWGTTSA